MTDRYAVVPIDDLVGYEIPGQARWHMIRATLGVQAFGINAWTATEDGQQLIGEHDEAAGEAHEELYVVLAGHATFTVDGEELDAPQGTVVHVSDPAVKRGAVGAAGTTVLVVGAQARGGVHAVAVGALGAGTPLLVDGGVGQGDRGARGPPRGDARQRRRATTTSPARTPAPVARTRRSTA